MWTIFLIFYKDKDVLERLKAYLHKEFAMKDIGPAKNCIGITITRGVDYIELDQRKYIERKLAEFGMSDCKTVKTPSVQGQKLTAHTITENNTLVGKVPYQEAVGSLLYLTQSTRPDIVHAVNTVSRFNNNHCDEHWQAVKRIFRYLKGTANVRLRYTKTKDFTLQAYSDADWGGDLEERKYCTGYIINFCKGAISWNSKLQPCIATSTTEAEYIALSTTVKEILWLKQFTNELCSDMEKCVTVLCDNQSAIKLAETEGYRPRTKHIDIKFHHIREQIEKGVVRVKFITTDEMLADPMTKSLPINKFQQFATLMGLTNH